MNTIARHKLNQKQNTNKKATTTKNKKTWIGIKEKIPEEHLNSEIKKKMTTTYLTKKKTNGPTIRDYNNKFNETTDKLIKNTRRKSALIIKTNIRKFWSYIKIKDEEWTLLAPLNG